jgi:bifunctional enzyme CysN/CysC
MTENALKPGKQYYIKQACRTVTGTVSAFKHRIDINTLDHFDTDQLQLNEIGLCEIALNAPIAFDEYTKCKGTGSFVVIDRITNVTVGAGMIEGLTDTDTFTQVSGEERAARFNQKASSILLTGANCSDIAYQLERKLFDTGHSATVLESSSAEQSVLIAAIKQAGLVCISVEGEALQFDLQVNTDNATANDIFGTLKEQKIIY